jgi:hypothetical protein
MAGRKRNAGTALVTGPDGQATRAVLAALGRRGYQVTRVVDPATLPPRAAESYALVFLVDVGWEDPPPFAYVKQYTRILSRAGGSLLVITHNDAVDDLTTLIATGARDFMVWPRDKGVLKARILALETAARAQQAADDARDQLGALLGAWPDTHLVLESDGVITDVARGNAGGEAPVGWLGRRIDEVLATPHGESALAAAQRASAEETPVSLIVLPEGESRRHDARLCPMPHGRVLAVLRPHLDAVAFAAGTEPPRRPVELGAAVASHVGGPHAAAVVGLADDSAANGGPRPGR